MVAVRIGPNMRMAAVAAQLYFARRRPPRVPQDLARQQCINLRLLTSGGFYAWKFEKAGRDASRTRTPRTLIAVSCLVRSDQRVGRCTSRRAFAPSLGEHHQRRLKDTREARQDERAPNHDHRERLLGLRANPA